MMTGTVGNVNESNSIDMIINKAEKRYFVELKLFRRRFDSFL